MHTEVTGFATANFVGLWTASFDYRFPTRPNQHTCCTNPRFHVLTRCKAFTHDAWEDLRVFFCIIPFKAHFPCVYPLSSYCWEQWATERLSYGRTQWASFEQAIDWLLRTGFGVNWACLEVTWESLDCSEDFKCIVLVLCFYLGLIKILILKVMCVILWKLKVTA